MNIEQQIRTLAARGEGKEETRKTLGLSHYQMRLYCSAMPDIVWPRQGCANGNKRHNLAQKGHFPPARQEAQRKACAAYVERHKVHDICGIVDTVSGHYARWRDLISVGRQNITWRLRQGKSTYDAFFLPKQKSAVHAAPGVRKQKYMAAIQRERVGYHVQ